MSRSNQYDEDERPDVMKFSVKNDFEGGKFDEDGEFYYATMKKGRKMTKEQALYGVFAEDDDDSGADDDFKSGKKAKNYGKFTNFVKSGGQSKKKDQWDDPDEDDDDDDDDEDENEMENQEDEEKAEEDDDDGWGNVPGLGFSGFRQNSVSTSSSAAASSSSSKQPLMAFQKSSSTSSKPKKQQRQATMQDLDEDDEEIVDVIDMDKGDDEEQQSAAKRPRRVPLPLPAEIVKEGSAAVPDKDKKPIYTVSYKKKKPADDKEKEKVQERVRQRSESPPVRFGRQPAKKQEPEQQQQKKKLQPNKGGSMDVASEVLGTGRSASVVGKMMASMGYEKGKGLGEGASGINTYIRVKQRAKGAGLGFHGDERTEQQKDLMEVKTKEKIKDELKDEKSAASISQRWKKLQESGGAAAAKKAGVALPPQKVHYLTAEELIAKQQAEASGVVKQKIIDMTGREVRVITNLSDASSRREEEAEAAAASAGRRGGRASILPELRHNLKVLVDLVETDIQDLDRKMLFRRQNMQQMEFEMDKADHDLSAKQASLVRLTEIQKVVMNCKQRSTDAIKACSSEFNQQQKKKTAVVDVDLDVDMEDEMEQKKSLDIGQQQSLLSETAASIASAFELLSQKYPAEYKKHNVSVLAAHTLSPLLLKLTANWKPLSQPLLASDAFSSLQATLSSSSSAADNGTYNRLVWEIIVPKLRTAILNDWQNIKDPEQIVYLLESWQPLLPPNSLAHILDQTLLPRLTTAVEREWDPRTDSVPIHRWIHPWLPLLASRFEGGIYTTIRQKLIAALEQWSGASDASALAVLSPWASVFDSQAFDQMIQRSIVPKLLASMRSLVINPQEQQVEPFSNVMQWSELVKPQAMIALMEAEFFPKWFHILSVWLTGAISANALNLEEVMMWYSGWKSLIPQSLQQEDKVRAHLTRALAMMNEALAQYSSLDAAAATAAQQAAQEYYQQAAALDARAAAQQQQSAAASSSSAQQSKKKMAATPSYALATGQLSIKELVERLAEEEDLAFVPKGGNRHEGKQVFLFGKLPVCFDTNNVFAQDEKLFTWKAVGLEEIVEMAHARRL